MNRELVACGVVALIGVLTGCSAGTEDGVDQSNDAISTISIQGGTFELYEQPGGPTTADVCHVKATLAFEQGNQGTLRKSYQGPCPVHAFPEEYPLQLTGIIDRCGSALLTSTTTGNGDTRSFRITDNRKRTCLGSVVAQIVVQETFTSRYGGTTTDEYFSFDNATAANGEQCSATPAPNARCAAACANGYKIESGTVTCGCCADPGESADAGAAQQCGLPPANARCAACPGGPTSYKRINGQATCQCCD